MIFYCTCAIVTRYVLYFKVDRTITAIRYSELAMTPNETTPRDLPYGLKNNLAIPHLCARISLFSSRVFADPLSPKAKAKAAKAKAAQAEPAQAPGTTEAPKKAKGGLPVRPVLHGVLIGCLGAARVTQRMGEQLDQDDADVYYALLRCAWLQPEPAADQPLVFRITAAELLKLLGWGTDGYDYDKLHACIERLLAATFIFDVPGLDLIRRGGTHLLQRFQLTAAGPRKSVIYTVELDPDFAKLHRAGWSLAAVAQRNELSDPLAKALHAFFATQSLSRIKKPYSIAELRDVSGRGELAGTALKAVRMDRFFDTLEAALDELERVCGWNCSLYGKGARATVVVDRTPAPKEITPKATPKKSNTKNLALNKAVSKDLLDACGGDYNRAYAALARAANKAVTEQLAGAAMKKMAADDSLTAADAAHAVAKELLTA